MFPRDHRLRQQKDVEFLQKRGQRLRSASFVVWWAPGLRTENWRVTVIAGKKVEKSAVKRNRIKRVLREAVRTSLRARPDFPALDMVWWVKHENEAATFDFQQIKNEVEVALSKLQKLTAGAPRGKI